ncbi:hypothetical protein ACET3X_001077 [Alternaria dauci]|uniref:ABM domain-containing protein n=1 Tax=Alternaria dauci TaxID=48095 RepID=A0ABR3UXC2_9PLEO
MSENVSEVVYMSMRPALYLSSGEAKEAWQSTLSTIAQVPGCKALYWGRQLENPDTVQMVVDWESIDAHEAFVKSPEYQPFISKIGEELITEEPKIFHVKFTADRSTSDNPFTMPVTECLNGYFPPDYNQDEYTSQFSKFRAEAATVPQSGASGIAGAWSVEPHQHESLGEGVDGKLFAMFIGWPSKEAHMEFRETEDFKRVAPFLRTGLKAMKVWHVAFQQYK